MNNAKAASEGCVLAGVAGDFAGVYNALQVLRAAELQPFHEGYEGDPSDDFLGRLDGWDWPVSG